MGTLGRIQGEDLTCKKLDITEGEYKPGENFLETLEVGFLPEAKFISFIRLATNNQKSIELGTLTTDHELRKVSTTMPGHNSAAIGLFGIYTHEGLQQVGLIKKELSSECTFAQTESEVKDLTAVVILTFVGFSVLTCVLIGVVAYVGITVAKKLSVNNTANRAQAVHQAFAPRDSVLPGSERKLARYGSTLSGASSNLGIEGLPDPSQE